MVRTFDQTEYSVQESTLPNMGLAARTQLSTIMAALDANVKKPLRLIAAMPTPDTKLYIKSNLVKIGDGTSVSTVPADDTLTVFTDTTIDFQATSSWVSGGTVLRDGGAFSLPTATSSGFFRRVYFVFASSGVINCTFSAEQSLRPNLPDPGTLKALIEGQDVGYIDIESTDTTKYKTAGSMSALIENAPGGVSAIFTFGSGGGGGGAGGEKPVKVTANFTAQKGKIYVVEPASGDITMTVPLNNASFTSIAFKDGYDLSQRKLIIAPVSGVTIFIPQDGTTVDGTLGETFSIDVKGASGRLDWDGTRWVFSVGGSAVMLSNVMDYLEVTKSAILPNLSTEPWLVDELEIDVPHTTIVGRAKIPNLANDLKASLGVERIMTQQIVQLQNETGPNGEPVYGTVNDERGLIRFVGSAWLSINSVEGVTVQSDTLNNFIEVTFYGTGLNILIAPRAATASFTKIVDGTSSGTVTFGGASEILRSRNYSQNAVISVASGLDIGVHTIRLVKVESITSWILGFEILNANTSGLVNLNSGLAYRNGQKINKLSASSSAYNSGVTGTKGGRVVKYLNADGSFGTVFTPVNASPAYLASADHANEEVARTYHWREFGCGRADDFSLVTDAVGGARAFTLDDGITTLVSSSAYSAGVNQVYLEADGSFFTLTFVGTGVDIVRQDTGNGGSDTYNIQIDGGSTQALPVAGSGIRRTVKLASGLAYGTHTLKINRVTASTWAIGIQQFIVYQPKKPILPASTLELCDYNVMADLVANSTAGINTISQGVLRKEISQREAVFVGADWSAPELGVTTLIGGWETFTNVAGQYFEYTFFGTGFEFRGYSFAGATWTIQVDEAYPSAVTYYGGFDSYTAGSGALTASSTTAGSGFRVVGLALGIHKIKVALTSGTYLYVEALDIITPIHTHKVNGPAVLQNTLALAGSMLDSRKLLPEPKKAWARAVGITSNPTTTSTTFVPVEDMELTIKTSGGALRVDFFGAIKNNTAANILALVLYIDGKIVEPNSASFGITGIADASSISTHAAAFSLVVPVSVGVHSVIVGWKVAGGTGTMRENARSLTVQEL